jgi:thioesterase domain-containing protein
VVFRASERVGEVLPFRELLLDDDLGWRELLGDNVTVVDAPGGHSNVLQQPHVTVVAPHFCAAFEASRASATVRRSTLNGRATTAV